MTRTGSTRRKKKGFTLVELMVVVAIIGILAAVGVPKLVRYLRTAETNEATVNFGRIADGITGYWGSRAQDPTTKEAAFDDYYTLDGDGTNEITTLIPYLTYEEEDAKFTYSVDTVVDGEDIVFCILAESTTNSMWGETGHFVYYSSRDVDDPIWENRIFRASFVDPDVAFVSGGTCSDDAGTATVP